MRRRATSCAGSATSTTGCRAGSEGSAASTGAGGRAAEAGALRAGEVDWGEQVRGLSCVAVGEIAAMRSLRRGDVAREARKWDSPGIEARNSAGEGAEGGWNGRARASTLTDNVRSWRRRARRGVCGGASISEDFTGRRGDGEHRRNESRNDQRPLASPPPRLPVSLSGLVARRMTGTTWQSQGILVVADGPHPFESHSRACSEVRL
jgi:hypothetical protein